jgi:guanine deaminase
MTNPDLMQRAIRLAEFAIENRTGGPFGALVARADNVIAEGWNCVTSTNDPTAHAEVQAIRAAARELGSFDLSGCVLYTSCEPCPMCLAAAYWARVDHIYYANTRADAAAIGFDDAFFYGELGRAPGERSLPATHVASENAGAAFRIWSEDPEKTPY